MNGYLILGIIGSYFGVLCLISYFTGRNADDETYFSGNKSSPWYLVAYGMIGTSLSGVTFISVPGWVATQQFSYMQMVLGYLIGYTVIALVLMPLYYRLNLVSIYQYLEERFGPKTYKVGAGFFLLSRTIGASFRLFLVAIVFQLLLEKLGYKIPFAIPVILSIALIYLYTFRGGIKTVVWTDTLQTTFMLLAGGLTIWWICHDMNLGISGMVSTVRESKYSSIFVWDWAASNHLIKHLLSGALIAIAMTGLDQDLMQKNLTCKNLGDARKNMFSFSVVLVVVNLLFLVLGALLYIYGTSKGILQEQIVDGKYQLLIQESMSNMAFTERGTDELYPILAMDYLPTFITILFILGLVAAAYSSADSALTALTTSFCVDFLRFGKTERSVNERKRLRYMTQSGFSVLIFMVILVFHEISNDAVISSIFKAAGYTYGPLLGLYAFGLFTKMKVRDSLVPAVCLLSPGLSFLIDYLSVKMGFSFGFLLLLLNGGLTFAGLWLVRLRK